MPEGEVKDNVWAAIGKYGVGVVFAVILLGILRYDMILPANEERRSTTDALIEANKANTNINTSLTDSYTKLTTSVEGQTEILRQIRDDQRQGIWRANPIPQPKPEQP